MRSIVERAAATADALGPPPSVAFGATFPRYAGEGADGEVGALGDARVLS